MIYNPYLPSSFEERQRQIAIKKAKDRQKKANQTFQRLRGKRKKKGKSR